MPNYQPVNRSTFSSLRWNRYQTYQFAARDALAPLVMQELPRMAMHLPIVFSRVEDAYQPAALLGLENGQNLLVAPDGRWLVDYVPAAYRGYPFVLARAEDDQMVLCFDTDSGLLHEQGEQTFFDEQGEPSEAVSQVLAFLNQVHQNRGSTERLCAALQAEALIVPWPLTLRSAEGERTLQGLYRIDEERLNSLPAEALARLQQAGALPMVYCQLLSMQHTQRLGNLAEAHAGHQADQARDLDLESLFGEDGDTLSFG